MESPRRETGGGFFLWGCPLRPVGAVAEGVPCSPTSCPCMRGHALQSRPAVRVARVPPPLPAPCNASGTMEATAQKIDSRMGAGILPVIPEGATIPKVIYQVYTN